MKTGNNNKDGGIPAAAQMSLGLLVGLLGTSAVLFALDMRVEGAIALTSVGAIGLALCLVEAVGVITAKLLRWRDDRKAVLPPEEDEGFEW